MFVKNKSKIELHEDGEVTPVHVGKMSLKTWIASVVIKQSMRRIVDAHGKYYPKFTGEVPALKLTKKGEEVVYQVANS